ncbi:MAG: CRISPR-associated protein Cmr4 [Candidatus Sumerlaeota bacterium]|nr:CRISPR-associated protein Cmr4 [Candidatus Sumerlaeota bacterium]
MSCSSLLLLHAETPLHPGTGSALGAVDLPVARERATGWPLVPGSSLKGVLRDTCRRLCHDGKDESGDLWAVFGGDTNNASEAAGALSVTDARLLAFPLRSLSGLFAWTTCPAALERLVRDARIGGIDNEVTQAAEALCKEAVTLRDAVSDKQALVAKNSPLKVGDNHLVFEEFDYEARECDAVQHFGAALDAALGGAEMRLKSHLAVISDNAFTFSTRYATEVSARIGLDARTKTVKDSALFYQEFLPAATIFSALALAGEPSAKLGTEELKSAEDVMKYVNKALTKGTNVVQVGGDASIGKGLCTVILMNGKEA